MDSGPGETFRKYDPPLGVQREATQLDVELDFNKALEETIALGRPVFLLYGTLVGDEEAAGHQADDVRIAMRYVNHGALRMMIRKLAGAAWKAGALSQREVAIIERQVEGEEPRK